MLSGLKYTLKLYIFVWPFPTGIRSSFNATQNYFWLFQVHSVLSHPWLGVSTGVEKVRSPISTLLLSNWNLGQGSSPLKASVSALGLPRARPSL